LISDKSKLKNLLKKAKVAIDSINAKYKQQIEIAKETDNKQREVSERNKDLL